MKAVAVYPRQKDSIHLAQLPEPALDDIAGGKGVLVKLLRCGLDGTDKEIAAGEYGVAPEGFDFLVEGHENFGVVEATGPNVGRFRPGDYVVCRVRRAGSSIYDLLDMPDVTTDEEYFEHGISRVHGFLTERYADDERYLIEIPAGLKDVAVLLEPVSVIEKGITQAYEVQRRLKVWQPERAAVLGAGTIGLLATMGLRNRGLEVTVFGLDEPPYLNSDLVEALGASYVSTKQTTLEDAGKRFDRSDLVFECTGFSPLVFDGARSLLAKNGVMVLSSVTGGERTTEVPSDAFNLDMVLGNKVMVGTVNANREHFEEGVRDMATAEDRWPGWLQRLITHRVNGLDDYEQAFADLGQKGTIKVVIEIATE
jgi:threonine dehydrogenase-like Zn-dependent dehydrogenase